MEQSARNEHSGATLSPADALLACIEAHKRSAYVQITPLRAVLPLVAAFVRDAEARIAALEAALTETQRQRMTLEAKLLAVVNTARAEGKLLPAIVGRPGGPIPGDQPL
jgi:hypothetical protein